MPFLQLVDQGPISQGRGSTQQAGGHLFLVGGCCKEEGASSWQEINAAESGSASAGPRVPRGAGLDSGCSSILAGWPWSLQS